MECPCYSTYASHSSRSLAYYNGFIAGNGSGNQSSNPGQGWYISLSSYILRKIINPSVLPPVEQTGFFSLGKATGLGEVKL